MADQSIHINYSFEDIQRYLQGKMSTAEMHAIEKAALQDPFLADAIEGYTEADAGISKQHLEEINAGLFAAEKRSKVIAFNRNTRWLRIAAMVIVIAGVGVLSVYLLKNLNNTKQVAQAKNESANTGILKDSATSENATILPEKEDTAFVIAQNKAQKPSLKQRAKAENADALLSRDSDIQNEQTAPIAMAAPVLQDETALRSYKAAPLSNEKSDSAQNILAAKAGGLAFSKNTFTGKIVDTGNNPVPFATITPDGTTKGSIADASGNFTLQQKDSLINVTVSTVGFNDKNVTLKYNDSNIIELTTPRKTSVMDVAVMALGKSAEEPVGGWENFHNYVSAQLNKDSSSGYFSDNHEPVIIEFLIDTAGNPYNLKIVKPLDKKRNAKAIEILKSGPKWTTSSKTKKARVPIFFD